MKKSDFLSYLFDVPIGVPKSRALTDLEMVGVFESMEQVESMEIKETPLAKALKDMGVKTDGMEIDADGFTLRTKDGDAFRAAKVILTTPENFAKFAELGWVASVGGDAGMTGEDADFVIKFLNIAPSAKPDEKADKPEDLAKLVKGAQEIEIGDEKKVEKLPGEELPGKPKAPEKPKHSFKEDAGTAHCGVCKNDRQSSQMAGARVCLMCQNEPEAAGLMEDEDVVEEEDVVPAAACPRCGGWTSMGGMSQHSDSEVEVDGRTGCTCTKLPSKGKTGFCVKCKGPLDTLESSTHCTLCLGLPAPRDEGLDNIDRQLPAVTEAKITVGTEVEDQDSGAIGKVKSIGDDGVVILDTGQGEWEALLSNCVATSTIKED